MKLRFKLSLIFGFFGLVGVDQLTKHFYAQSKWAHQNQGILLQAFESAPHFARVVLISTFYGFLFFAFFGIQTLMIRPYPLLRSGLTILFAGVTGNAIDRALIGSVTDFISIPFGAQFVIFNLADVWMWAGLICLVLHAYQNRKQVFWNESQRKRLLIQPRYQLRLAMKIAFASFSGSLILILFSFTYFSPNLTSSTVSMFPFFWISALLIATVFSTVTFLLSLVWSHRSVGPWFAFEKYVDHLLKNPGERRIRNFTLREGDEHVHLQLLAKKLSTHLNEVAERKSA